MVGLHRGPAAAFTGGDQGQLDSHHSPAAQLSGRQVHVYGDLMRYSLQDAVPF